LFYPHGGGAEFATYLYAKLLGKAGSEVAVVTNRMTGEPEFSKKEDFDIYRLPLFENNKGLKYSIFMRFDILLSKFIRDLVKWADVVYVPRFWYSAIPFVKALGKPVITHIHDFFPICSLSNRFNVAENKLCNVSASFCSPKCIYSYERMLGKNIFETLTSIGLNLGLGKVISKLAKFSDAVICVSKFQKQIIIDQDASFREKINVIYNPLSPAPSIKMEGDDFAYFGGFNYLKGFQTLFQAVKYMNRRSTNHNLTRIHVTNSSESFGQSPDSLREQGLLVYRKLSRVECDILYKQIRAVIVPSICPEALPYVVSEAITRGRFVIASRIGGIPELVENCKGAILFEPGNEKELANAIEVVKAMDRKEIVSLGLQSKKKFNMNFNNERSIKEFIRICESLTK